MLNRMPKRADVAIVGAGILGLAHAYVLARKGKRVVLFERGHRASGALGAELWDDLAHRATSG